MRTVSTENISDATGWDWCFQLYLYSGSCLANGPRLDGLNDRFRNDIESREFFFFTVTVYVFSSIN